MTAMKAPDSQTVPNGYSALDDGKKKITRTRISYSCHECRKRKVKCDKVHPRCGNCSRSNETCTYDVPDQSKSGEISSFQDDLQYHGTKRSRESSLLPTSNNLNFPTDQRTPSSASQASTVEARLDRLTAMVEALRQDQLQLQDEKLSEVEAQSATTDIRANDDSNPTLQSQMGSMGITARIKPQDIPLPDTIDQIGYLSLSDHGRSRYVGASYFAYVSDELGQLNQILRDQTKHASATAPITPECSEHCDEMLTPDEHSQNSDVPEAAAQRRCPSSLQVPCETDRKPALSTMMLFQNLEEGDLGRPNADHQSLVDVPTKSQSNILFRCWFSGIHSTIPIVYPPVVFEQYEQFWDWYDHKDEKSPIPCPQFLPLLFAIWYAGSVSMSIDVLRREFGYTSRSSLSARFHDQIVKWLLALDFPRDSGLSTLAAFLMVTSLSVKQAEPLSSSMNVAMAVRSAQQMGLHRDPEHFNLPAWEMETRRRLWWHIHHLDILSAVASGLPPIIGDDNFWDVKPISELKDAHIGTPEGDAYIRDIAAGTRSPQTPEIPLPGHEYPMVDVHYVVAKAKYQTDVYYRRLLKIQLGTSPVTRKDFSDIRATLAETDEFLQATVIRIPADGVPELGYCPNSAVLLGTPEPEKDMPPSAGLTLEDLKPLLGFRKKPGEVDGPFPITYHWRTLIGFHAQSRTFLSLLADKAFCLILGTFLRHSNSKLWSTARRCAIHHSHAFMREFLALASNENLQPFHWSWPGAHQPLHAAMILLVDLWDRPKSEEASISRAYIDQIFSMSEPGSAVACRGDRQSAQRPLREAGHEAWAMLRYLRDQAWRKAGLDPHVYWTFEKQAEANAAKDPGSSNHASQDNDEPPLKRKPPMDGEVAGQGYADPYSDLTQDRGGGLDIPTTMSEDSHSTSIHPTTWSTGSAQNTNSTTPMDFSSQINGASGEDFLDTQFDWEAWDNVFGQHKMVDEMMWYE